MHTPTPKVIKMENLANIFRIEFDNGAVKYVKSDWVKDLLDAVTPGEAGKGKRVSLLGMGANMWIGTEITIAPDGNVTVNGKKTFTSQELWAAGKDHVSQL